MQCIIDTVPQLRDMIGTLSLFVYRNAQEAVINDDIAALTHMPINNPQAMMIAILKGNINSIHAACRDHTLFKIDLAKHISGIKGYIAHFDYSISGRCYALDLAAASGYTKVVEMLCQNGAVASNNAMNFAAGNNDIIMLEWLQKNKISYCSAETLEYASGKKRFEIELSDLSTSSGWLHDVVQKGNTT
jgi:hypothetical protein